MPEYEYKIMKMAHNWQEFYNDTLACFGWKVESIEETVEGVDTSSFGVSTGSAYTHGSATVFLPGKYSSTVHAYGNAYTHSFGTQMGNEQSTINKLVAVKYRRERSAPERDTLDWLEGQCWPHINAYIERNRTDKYNFHWSEWQALLRYRFLGENAIKAAGKALPAAEGSFPKIFAEHNVVHEGQTGVNIHCKMKVKNRNGMNMQRILYFTDENGHGLADVNNCFNDLRGAVGAIVTSKSTYDDCVWEDTAIFFPYAELHLRNGKCKLKYKLLMFDMSADKAICESETRELFYEQRGGKAKSYDNYPPEQSLAVKKPDFAPTYLAAKSIPQKKKGGWVAIPVLIVFLAGFGLLARYLWMQKTAKEDLQDYFRDTMWVQQNEDGSPGRYAIVLVKGHEYSDELHVGLIGDAYDEILDNKSGITPEDLPWRYNVHISKNGNTIDVTDGYYTLDEVSTLTFTDDKDMLTVDETSDDWGDAVEEIFSGTYIKVD